MNTLCRLLKIDNYSPFQCSNNLFYLFINKNVLMVLISAPEEAHSRNMRASGTLKFGFGGVLKI